MKRTICFWSGFLVLAVSPAQGAEQSLSLLYGFSNDQVSAFREATDAPTGISTMEERLTYQADQIDQMFNVAAGLVLRQPDYGSYLISREDDTLVPLGDSVRHSHELEAELVFAYDRNGHRIYAGWNGSVSASPFAYQSFSVGAQEAIFNRSTVFGLDAAFLRQDQPASYFLNRNLRRAARPGRVNAHEINLSVEQTLTESWKVLGEVGTARRVEERPRAYGFSLATAYAFTSRFTGQMKGKYWAESQAVPLLNERGYFSWTVGEGSLQFEPFYDFWITTSYGIGLEREADPDTLRTIQVASEQFGLGFRYRRGEVEFQLQGAYLSTNTLASGFQAQGGMTWKL